MLLTHTFCHLPKVGPKKELALWSKGIHTWDDFAAKMPKPELIQDSQRYLEKRDPTYFADHLKPDQMWRLFPAFRNALAYVDIESTGIDRYGNIITTIALYDGKRVRTYIHGKNLDQFPQDIHRYKIIVTFNGRAFDVPFIEHYFGIKLNQAHIDLRPVLRGLGHKGPLKAIEKRFGIDRKELKDVDGYFAVILWHEYKRRNNKKALETLLAYNVADVVNLETLLVKAYNMHVQETPFAHEIASFPKKKLTLPHKADAELLRRLS